MKVFRFTINASLGNSFNTAFDSVSGKISGLVSQMKGLNSIGKEIPVNIGKRLASIGGAGLRIRLGAKAWNFGKILPVVYQRQAKKLKAAWPGVRKVLDLDSEDQFKQMRQDMIISDPRFLRGKRHVAMAISQPDHGISIHASREGSDLTNKGEHIFND